MFAAKAGEVPALRDPMTVVERRAGQVRRRHRTVVASAIAVLVTLTLLAGFRIGEQFRSTPPVSPSPLGDQVEMIVNDELVRSDGTRIRLEGRRHIQGAARTPAGLLYLDADGLLRVLRPDGAVQSYGQQFGRLFSFTVSRDGRRIAASGGPDPLFRATLSAEHGIQNVQVMSGPAAVPWGWYGDDVVLRAVTVSTRQRYGLWRADADKATGWGEAQGVFLLGETLDTWQWYWGRKRGNDLKWCLVQLDPTRRFKVVNEFCDLGFSETSMMSVSPDSHFLVAAEPGEKASLWNLDSSSVYPERSILLDGCRSTKGLPDWAGRNVLRFGELVCRIEPSGEVTVGSMPPLPPKARVISVTRYGL